MSKRKFTTVIILTFAFFLALILALSAPVLHASAWRIEPDSSLALDNEGKLKKSVLPQLYGQLVEGASSLENLRSAATKAPVAPSNANGTGAAEFSQKNIIVSLGGKKWTPVHLTTDTDGNIILTLWLAWTTEAESWSKCDLGFENKDRATQNDDYPLNMYSSSYIRAYLNGTDYLAEVGSSTLADGQAVQSGEWKTFLSAFGEYIVAPEKIAYQACEPTSEILSKIKENSGGVLSDSYDFLNEGYAEDGLKYNLDEGYDYRSKTGYADWKTDKLWLPSLSETGHGHYTKYVNGKGGIYFTNGEKDDGGIWNTTWDQCTTDSHAYNIWLRSACTNKQTYSNGSLVETLTITSAMSAISCESSKENYVRPAIHLNLTAIEGGAQQEQLVSRPTETNVLAVYDGQEHSLQISDYIGMNFGEIPEGAEFTYGKFSAVSAGTYQLSATPKAGKWEDGTTNSVTFTLEVSPCPVTVYICGGKDGGFHIFGQTPTVSNLRLSPSGEPGKSFVGDDGIAELGEIQPILTSRKDGRAYPFNAELPVGSYDITIENGVYGNYNVTFDYSAAFDDISENVYAVLPSDNAAVLVDGYLVEDNAVTIPYDGNRHAPTILNYNYTGSIGASYYKDGQQISGNPFESGVYTVYLTRPITFTFTLTIEEDNLPPAKPTEEQLSKTATYTGNRIALNIPKSDKLNFGAVPEGAMFVNGLFSAIDAGEYQLTATPKEQWDDGTTDSVTYTLTINKADIDFGFVAYRIGNVYPDANGFVVKYNGSAQFVEIVNLPPQVTAKITYTQNGTEVSPINVGTYQISIGFNVSDDKNYNVPSSVSFSLVVTKGDVDLTNVEFKVGGKTAAEGVFEVKYDGESKSLTVSNLPQGVTASVSYFQNGKKMSAAPTDMGEYVVTVSFDVGENFNTPQEKEFMLKIIAADAGPDSPTDPTDPDDPSKPDVPSGPDDPTQPDTPSEPDAPMQSDETEPFPWWWIVVGVVATALAIAAAIVAVRVVSAQRRKH